MLSPVDPEAGERRRHALAAPFGSSGGGGSDRLRREEVAVLAALERVHLEAVQRVRLVHGADAQQPVACTARGRAEGVRVCGRWRRRPRGLTGPSSHF